MSYELFPTVRVQRFQVIRLIVSSIEDREGERERQHVVDVEKVRNYI